MALLDELKKQAQDATLRQAEGQHEERSRAATFRKLAHPAMLRGYHYLRELVDSVQTADPDIRCSYEVKGAGRLRALRQHDYALAADDVPDVTSMTLSFVCSREELVRFRVRTRKAVQQQREYLWRHGLLFTFREDLGSTGVQDYVGSFEMEAHVRVAVSFQIDAAQQRIRFVTKNLDQLGEETFLIGVERFDVAFLEEVGKAVLRKPNRLSELTGFKVPDDVRAQLQERLEREAEEKGRELGQRGGLRRAKPEPAAGGSGRRGFLAGLFRRR